MRGAGPFAALRMNMFGEPHVGLAHPHPPPFSQEKGERNKNGRSRTGLLALESLGHWPSRDFFQPILEDRRNLFGNGVSYTKGWQLPSVEKWASMWGTTGGRSTVPRENNTEEALRGYCGPGGQLDSETLGTFTGGLDCRWERITIKFLPWTLATSWHNISEELRIVGSAKKIYLEYEPKKYLSMPLLLLQVRDCLLYGRRWF